MNQFFSSVLTKLAHDYIVTAKILIIGLVTTVATLAYFTGVFDRVEYLSLDQRFKLRENLYAHPKIILVEIADDSIDSVGRWPWDREWHATLVKALNDFGAKTIAFDILFSEPSNPLSDQLMAKVMGKGKNVLLATAFTDLDETRGSGIVQPIPVIKESSKYLGHISITPDADGVLRRIKMGINYSGKIYPQLGLLMTLDYLGVDPNDVEYYNDRVEVPLSSGDNITIPLTHDSDYLISWPGLWTDTFEHVSFVDIVVAYTQWLKNEETRIPIDMFKDSICLVGVSALGLFDIRSTPLEAAYPAMGVNASIANAILNQEFLKPVHHLGNLFVILLMSVMIFLIMLRSNYLQTMSLIILLAFVYTIAASAVFVYAGIVVTMVYPLFLILVSYIVLTAYHQIVISIEKKRLVKLATTDPLTSLYNIAHFKRLLQAELISAQLRKKRDISLVMVDGDFFKKVNDQFGHAVGDDVLKGIADVLKSNCRALDVAARYGGEEFIVMLPGAVLEAALKVAEKMRAGIEERRFQVDSKGNMHQITASFGVSSYTAGESMDAFMKRADEALYLAKESGRNCVCTK